LANAALVGGDPRRSQRNCTRGGRMRLHC
jgi:hypothetical protein